MAETKDEKWEQQKRRLMALAVRTVRRSRGMSKEELAEKAGYKDTGMITAIENASKDAAYDKVKDIANALDVSIDQLRCSGNIGTTASGKPRLNEAEKIALYLIAPIIKDFTDDDVRQILDICLVFRRCKENVPEWRQTAFQAEKNKTEKKTKVEDYPDFRELYERYMFREIGIFEFAERLGTSPEEIKRLIKEFLKR